MKGYPMENQEEEFLCSDCGATVSSDAKSCPNCGSSLEDLSKKETSNQEEFVEFAVTSHPVNLSSILSLLDENKIEYSINDSAMDNIWGPNFTQLPRLLIRKDQYEIVKEIITSFESNGVTIIEDKAFPNAPTKDDVINRIAVPDFKETEKELMLKGVDGWLLFFCLSLMLGPIAYLPYTIKTYFEIKEGYILLPMKDIILNVDIVLTILISFLSAYAGWNLWKIRPNAIYLTRLYLNIILIYSVFTFILITILFLVSNIPFDAFSQFIYGAILKETILSVVYVVIWKLYLKNSERVKNTFRASFEFTSE
jgi:ribosomal protein L40E